MKTLILPIISVIALSCGAIEVEKLSKEEVSAMSVGERMAYLTRLQEAKTGGRVIKPGTGKGVIKIVNAQNSIPTTALEAAVKQYATLSHITVLLENGAPVTLSTVKESVPKIGAQAAVFIIEDDALPRVIHSPEEGWVIVNAKALVLDNPKAEVKESRLSKMSMRGLAFLGGIGEGAQGAGVVSPVKTLEDIDKIPTDRLTGLALSRMPIYLAKYGIEPYVVRTYRRAMEEGWAPAPTNEFQKAIWEEFNRTPTKPIRIKYDPKKGE